MLNQLDYYRSKIGKCPEKCEGLDAEDDEGLCPVCCEWFAKVLVEEERLGGDKEYNELMKRLE